MILSGQTWIAMTAAALLAVVVAAGPGGRPATPLTASVAVPAPVVPVAPAIYRLDLAPTLSVRRPSPITYPL